MCRSGCWLVRRVVRESGVAVVGQSVTASRYVDCVVPCKSVEVEERLGLCRTPSRADVSDGSESFAVSKPCGRWLWLGSRQCRADVSDGNEGFVVSKPCGRIGRERRLCSVKAERGLRPVGLRIRLRVCHLAVYFDWSLLTARDALTRRQ